MEIILFAIGITILFFGLLFYVLSKISKRRLKKSSYGNSFDFSKIPNHQIATVTKTKYKK